MSDPIDVDELFRSFAARPGHPMGGFSLSVTLREAAEGAHRTITANERTRCVPCEGKGHPIGATSEPCDRCAGTGKLYSKHGDFQITSHCAACHGTGVRWSASCKSCEGSGAGVATRTLEVTVPPGTTTGTKLTLTGADGVERFVLVTVAPHATLVRDGDHLRARVRFVPERAASGGTLIVPWLDGDARVPMPAGSRAGDELRLPGWGCVKLGASYAPPPPAEGDPYRTAASARGDLIVTLVEERSLASAYRILGVHLGATRREIDDAHRRLSMALDPQRHPENEAAPSAFARLNDAYAQITSLTSGTEPETESERPPAVAIVAGVLTLAAAIAYLVLR